MLLHMISEDRDLLSTETQEMKRQTWVRLRAFAGFFPIPRSNVLV